MNASRRSKSFQSATGISYRYFFDSQGQSIPFEMIVYIADCALAAWRERQGRELDAQEKYVATKLGLFRGFDEEENLRENWLGRWWMKPAWKNCLNLGAGVRAALRV